LPISGPRVRPRRPAQRVLHGRPAGERGARRRPALRRPPPLRLQAAAHRGHRRRVGLRGGQHEDLPDPQGARRGVPRRPGGGRGDGRRRRGRPGQAHAEPGRDRRRPQGRPLGLRGLRRRQGRRARLRLRAPRAAGGGAPHGRAMSLVAGVDSSTQSCTVVIRDAETGALVRSGRAKHPDGTEVHPSAWWEALQSAIADAGGLDGVEAIAVAGQQHGMVCLDESGEVVRPALLWNDTRSAGAADDLVAELGAGEWAEAVGSVPVASFTVTKLRWLAQHEPEHAAATAAVCLPHDWLTWKLLGTGSLDDLVTDRSDASGTGYFSGVTGEYRLDLLERALGRSDVRLPRVLGPAEAAGRTPDGVLVGPGAG